MSTRPGSCPPRIERFDTTHLEAVIECVTTTWTTDNVIARALGVSARDYRPVAAAICTRALAEDLGLMLREPDTDRIVGFTTAIDLVDEIPTEQVKTASDNPRIARWGAFLGLGLRWYTDAYHSEQPLERGQVVYFNIGGTTPEHRGQGWIGRMVMAMGMLCLPRGYQRVVGIATHAHTVSKTRSIPFASHLHELRFAESNDPDLARITDPPCALVSVTPLAPDPAEPRVSPSSGSASTRETTPRP